MLRQRCHRILLGQNANRATQPATVEDPDRVGQRDLRIPGDLPQPPTPSLRPGNANPDRIRNDATIHPTRGLKSSIPTPQVRGNITLSGLAGEPQSTRIIANGHRDYRADSINEPGQHVPVSIPGPRQTNAGIPRQQSCGTGRDRRPAPIRLAGRTRVVRRRAEHARRPARTSRIGRSGARADQHSHRRDDKRNPKRGVSAGLGQIKQVRTDITSVLTCIFGGAKGTRTPDPHTASVVRYQLRHSPEWCAAGVPRLPERSYTTWGPGTKSPRYGG